MSQSFFVKSVAFFLLSGVFFVMTAGAQARIQMTVLYDNVPYKNGLITKDGFSCIIRGTEKTILFDTGGEADILQSNMKQLGIDPGIIDSIVLSHEHDDHTGGVLSILETNHRANVFIPEGFADNALIEKISALGNSIVTVRNAMSVCPGVFSTGPIKGGGLVEQSLVIKAKSGLILVCGCAHPGIIHIIEESTRLFKEPIIFAFGGFHFKYSPDSNIMNLITQLVSHGVIGLGASHCTGEKAIEALKSIYGKTYFPLGVGSTIALK